MWPKENSKELKKEKDKLFNFFMAFTVAFQDKSDDEISLADIRNLISDWADIHCSDKQSKHSMQDGFEVVANMEITKEFLDKGSQPPKMQCD